jgi:hypothetical protein
VPALLRREHVRRHYDEQVDSTQMYERLELTPKSLEEADPIYLDDGSTIDVRVELGALSALESRPNPQC